VNQWKATEFRQFLLYLSLVVLDDLVPSKHMKMFTYMQYVLFKIGGFKATPIPERDLQEAQEWIEYIVFQIQKICCTFSVPPVIHNFLHIVNDCRHFGVQLDNLSAFIYENHMGFFRNNIHSGNRKMEQLQNRLAEYLCNVYVQDENGDFVRNIDGKPVLRGFGPNHRTIVTSPTIVKTRMYSTLITKDFVLSSKLQDCWCKIKCGDGELVVKVENFNYDAVHTDTKRIFGRRVLEVSKNRAFPKPDSRKFGVFKLKGLSNVIECWSIEAITGKLFVMPDMVALERDFPNANPENFLPSQIEKFVGEEYWNNSLLWSGIVLRHCFD